jgi:hypothetical protein
MASCAQSIFRSEEALRVDGAVVAHQRTWLSFGAYLSAAVLIDESTHVVSAKLAPVRNGSFGIGCLLYVDDKLIGGDIGVPFVWDVQH